MIFSEILPILPINLLMMGEDVNDWDDIGGQPAKDQNNNTSQDCVTFYLPISKVKDQEESLKKIRRNIHKADANVKEKYFEDFQNPNKAHLNDTLKKLKKMGCCSGIYTNFLIRYSWLRSQTFAKYRQYAYLILKVWNK